MKWNIDYRRKNKNKININNTPVMNVTTSRSKIRLNRSILRDNFFFYAIKDSKKVGVFFNLKDLQLLIR